MDPVTVAKKTRRPVDVRAWALFTACATAFSLAVGYSMSHAHALDHFHAPCWQWQFSFLPCDQLMDADKAVVNAVCLGMLSCVPVLAAWAVLALRLLCRRRWVRRALACLALALTIVGHCLYATAACLVLVAHQGNIFIRICWTVGIFLVPFSFSVLQDLHLLGGDEE
ncbi:uncharacterized protein LOC119305125 [Triticum dicoccoides]|uniref:uncharacterized protein LOC119305125 n=1 Tax=Triticum dicoccoides TaxID=85692 RepID=UPI00188F4D4E|nr:uncharacterized protein LOC119305125 [Triticum dicoccoides]